MRQGTRPAHELFICAVSLGLIVALVAFTPLLHSKSMYSLSRNAQRLSGPCFHSLSGRSHLNPSASPRLSNALSNRSESTPMLVVAHYSSDT